MARKKKTSRINPSIFKYTIIGILVISFFALICIGVYRLASQSSLFTVKEILVDDSVNFINKSIFRKIEGQNIFQVDLNTMQKRLIYRYPQISDLKVVRLFPDQLLITAKKRLPFIQTMVNNVIITLDDEGIVISTKSKREDAIPFVIGIDPKRIKIALGKPIRTNELRAVLLVLKKFQSNELLSAYDVEKVNIERLSRIHLYLSNDLRIIMDSDHISQKLKDLGLFLSSKRLDIDKTKYIDLRNRDIVVTNK